MVRRRRLPRGSPDRRRIPQRESSLYVANPSGDLIYEVQGVYGSRDIGTLGGAVPPGRIAEFGTDIVLIWRVHPCGVRFVDARGLGWERSSSGRLRRHRDADITGLWAWRKQQELRARERDYEKYKRDLIAKHAADEAAVAGDGVSSGNDHA
ncbi:hypothetical protein [Promicromonospora umidemergens]|uniref:RAMA domain-containing protein n=1 Tax=Promicromonospora umidemergens TaxID=629679 RepID=A0ABP8XTB0_9MICO|nr:hypothetical protein [Promicromonospora umidemergens]